jgi:hypothetical protein
MLLSLAVICIGKQNKGEGAILIALIPIKIRV